MVKFVAKLDHQAFDGQVCQQSLPLNAVWLSLATKLTFFSTKNNKIFVYFPQMSSNFHQFENDLNCKQQIKM